jgi:hypothetical protein
MWPKADQGNVWCRYRIKYDVIDAQLSNFDCEPCLTVESLFIFSINYYEIDHGSSDTVQ